MKRFAVWTFLLCFVCLLSCDPTDLAKIQRPYFASDFPNILDVIGEPDSAGHRAAFSFSDMGAWHAYALPNESEPGGFAGPFLMTQNDGIWLSPSLLRLELKKLGSDHPLDLKTAKNITLNYLPGKLEQSFEIEDISVQMSLIFIDHRTALVETSLSSETEQTLQIDWNGEHWFGSLDESNPTQINFENGSYLVTEFSEKVEINQTSDQSFSVSIQEPVTLVPGVPQKSYYTQSVYFDATEAKESPIDPEIFQNPGLQFSANRNRWNGYLPQRSQVKYPEHIDIWIKAIQTMMTNWRSPAQDIKHNGLFPSYTYSGFHGVWSWDSWKHAVAIALFDPELAKEQLRVMYDYQDEMGMIADVIYRNKDWNNWRDTKPPLSAWAIWKIYEQDEDLDFLKEMYPKVTKYHAWWYQYRDNDQNGLCEYGSADGTRIAAAWESGMDNAVRFDDAVMVKNNENGWSLNQESVDLNSYLYAEKGYLSKIANAIGNLEESTRYTSEAQTLKQLVQDSFYDPENGFFYDKVLGSSQLKKVEGTEGWTALWAGIATQEQADRVIQTMLDTAKFNTFVPLPTFTKDHPKFNPRRGYWRGPVWLDQFYFGIKSLQAYGYEKEAEDLIEKLIQNAEGIKQKGMPIRENYHPITGEGLNANHFSWSAAHLLLLLQKEEPKTND